MPVWPTTSQLAVIENDHVVPILRNSSEQLVGNLVGAHLGLEVIGRDLGDLTRIRSSSEYRLSHPAVEENGLHGHIFFCFRNPQLSQALFGNIFAEGIGQRLWPEGHLHVRHGGIILSHAHIGQREEALLALAKTGKIRVNEGTGDLPVRGRDGS